MFTLIEFCSSNMLKGTEDLYKTLDSDPEIDVLDYSCLGNCGLCSKAYYVMVDGKIVSATTPEKLLEKIYQRIDRNKQEEDAWFEDLK